MYMKTVEIVILLVWYLLGFSAILTILIREEGWTPRETTIGDVLCLLILPIFGPNIWAFYGVYLLMEFDVLNKPLFKNNDDARN
jgi:hypothetical protein